MHHIFIQDLVIFGVKEINGKIRTPKLTTYFQLVVYFHHVISSTLLRYYDTRFYYRLMHYNIFIRAQVMLSSRPIKGNFRTSVLWHILTMLSSTLHRYWVVDFTTYNIKVIYTFILDKLVELFLSLSV